ncbi:MAG TPA: SDR family NAD(P)-dependent oxidoreductase [Bradyrhizobium sp.]|nr:SDR family NAD(P)-dependent oxidoreductase [Bradyrhizobium sp.]
MKNRVVLITGSTDGVGRRLAERLGQAGATVLIHGRDATRADLLCEAIRSNGGRAFPHLADFASLGAVRTLAAHVQRDHGRLDILINNAGIGVGRPEMPRELSRDGHELRFAVNYLAGFLLTRLLLPALVASKGRIVNVASIGQHPLDFTDIMLSRAYSGRRAYCQSKLAQVIFTFDLADELASTGVCVNALHPATYMDTTMVRRDGIQPVSSIDEGADAILHLAAATELAGQTGLYFDGRRPARADPQAYDATARKLLRALSFELTGLSPTSAS